MPGRVITVDRREGRRGALRWSARSRLGAVLRGTRIALREVRRSLRRPAAGRGADGGASPAALRAVPVLVQRADGTARCVACGLCELACPTACIAVTAGEGPRGREPLAFDLDLAECLLCGLCEEACPERAIAMGPLPAAAREGLRLGLHDLLVPEERFEAGAFHAGDERAERDGASRRGGV